MHRIGRTARAGADGKPAQLAGGHRCLHPAPGFYGKTAVVDANGQRLVILVPQLLEDQLGKAAGVGEDERRPVLLDQPHHVCDRMIA